MKVEARIFFLLSLFFFIVAAAYAALAGEPVGTSGLVLVGFMALLIAFFAWYTGRGIDPRPEDDDNAEISDLAGDYGFFSPHSWWPLALGIASAMAGLGLIFGWWLFIAGAMAIIAAAIGLVFEYYRGPYADEAH